MDELKHRNDIEIKLLPNRRFIYSNRRSNIVITAENKATEITVLFPDEYEDYSKRVDFVNSQGKEWTEGLYTPEYEKHAHGKKNHGDSKCKFRFTLPTEVTTAGELKMQFLAYIPDESMTTVPFEIITIDVQDGVLAFKRNAKANPDLLILSYNRSTEALFKSEQAKAKSEAAVATSNEAKEFSEQAVAVSEQAKAVAESADDKSDTALANVAALAGDLAAETQARELGDAENAQATQDETSARVEAVAQEAQAREAADAGLSADIAAEATARENAVTAEAEVRAQAIAEEAEQRAQGDIQNAEAITAETARATAAEAQIAQDASAAVAAEAERATQAESNLAAGLQTETERATSRENANEQAIQLEAERATAAEQANAQAIVDEATARQEAVAQEVEARQAADTTEAQARIQGDEANAQAIANEATVRAQNDETNAGAITVETQRATTAEGNLQTSVNAEKARAQNAENALTNAITAEELRAATAEQTNANAIVTEKTRAQTAEGNLSSAIVTENARAVVAETNIGFALVTETGRATMAEAGLSSAINSEAVRATTQEGLLSTAIANEQLRASTQETILSDRINNALGDAVSQANNYTDQAVEQVRIDGTVYKGTILESELPTSNQTNGDLYWISDFDISKPEHAGSAIWNGTTNAWDFSVDKYKHEDGDTIVPRTSDGALKVADTDESDLTADTTNYGTSVQTGFKATIRNLIRKIKGLFQRTTENETAIVTEASRAQTAESGLSSDLAAEATRAQTAEQNVADAITAEATRATTAEQANAALIQAEATRAIGAEDIIAADLTAETARAAQAEQQNAFAISGEAALRAQGDADNLAAIEAETARAQTAESGKVEKVSGKGLSSEDYTTEEKAKLASIESGNVQSDWNESDSGSDSYIKNKPAKAHAATTMEYGAASKSLYGHVKFYGNANGDSTELLSSPTYEHFYNSSFDCNDYMTAGRVYQNHTRSGAGASINNPLGNILERFCLEVYTIPGDTSTIFQRYISITFAREFVRKYASGVWSSWQERPITADIEAEIARANQAENDLLQAIADEVARAQTAEAGKVDKITGKGLSSEDYTTMEKTKLAGLENGGGADPDAAKYKGKWSSSVTYAKGDIIFGDTSTMGIDGCASWVSLVDNNLNHAPLYSDSFTNAYWQPLGAYSTSGFIGRCRYPEIYARGSNATTLNKKRGLVLTDVDTYNEKGINGTLAVMRQGFGQITSEDNNDYIVYEKGGELYDARGKLAAQSEIPSGASGDYLPLTGGEVTGDITLKYPSKLIGSGNGQQAADWLKYDNSTNYLTIGNTGTVPELASAAAYVYRKNSAGSRFKFYDEGNKPTPADIGAATAITETALTFSGIHASVSNLSGYYLKDSAAHGRIFLRLTTTASITNWTSLFTITNSDIPSGMAAGNRLGMTTTMGQGSFNGSSLISVSFGISNGVMTGQSLSSGWDYTMVINY